MNVSVEGESRGKASVAWLKGSKHKFYEDRYRILSEDIPLVRDQNRGEIFGVFDGIGSAPKGRQAAQEMADQLLMFYADPGIYEASEEGLEKLLLNSNETVHGWGFIGETDVPKSGCAGTVAPGYTERTFLFFMLAIRLGCWYQTGEMP